MYTLVVFFWLANVQAGCQCPWASCYIIITKLWYCVLYLNMPYFRFSSHCINVESPQRTIHKALHHHICPYMVHSVHAIKQNPVLQLIWKLSCLVNETHKISPHVLVLCAPLPPPKKMHLLAYYACASWRHPLQPRPPKRYSKPQNRQLICRVSSNNMRYNTD